jgi:hypothetical protein
MTDVNKGGEIMGNVQIEVTCTYDQDTKRMHRYLIDQGQSITGVIYVPKTAKPPESVTLKLQVKGQVR